MAIGTDEQQATPPSAGSDNAAATVARLETLAKSPDPLAAAFGLLPTGGVPGETAPQEAPKDTAAASPPPPVSPGGNPEVQPKSKAAEPKAQSPDPDTASPEELRAYAKQHPNWAKAIGLEVRDYAQKRGQELQREQQARAEADNRAAQAQQAAEAAAEQARLATEYYEPYYDEEHPEHLDALRFYAQLGVAPMEIQKVIESPVVQQHVGTVANQYAQQAAAQAQYGTLAATIQAAESHPVLGALGEEGLRAVWEDTPWEGQLTPKVVADFYERAYLKLGYLAPKAAEEFKKTYSAAADKAASTRAWGDYPPAEGSVVPNGTYPQGGLSLPTDKTKIDPDDLFLRGFAHKT